MFVKKFFVIVPFSRFSKIEVKKEARYFWFAKFLLTKISEISSQFIPLNDILGLITLFLLFIFLFKFSILIKGEFRSSILFNLN